MLSILVVEGESAIADTLIGALETEKFEVTHVSTAGDGLEHFQSHDPDFAVLDIGLPDFTALTGTSLKLIEIVQGLASALALTGALLLGFAPVLWVFSQSSESQPFFGFLVIATWLISVLFGTDFLMKILK